MSLKPADIDYIIDKLQKMTAAAQKQKGRDVSTLSSLQKELKLCLVPRWDDIWPYTTQSQRDPGYKREHRAYGNVKYDLQRDIEQSFLKEPLDSCVIIQNSQKIIDEMECIRVIFDYNQPQVPTETGQAVQKTSGGKVDLPVGTEGKNKGIFRRIPYWIYILTLFFAALLTCLFYLGCLEPIKAFIKILLHK